jgi:hypothetical protein
LITLKRRHGSALTSALCFFIATFLKTDGSEFGGFAPIGMVKYWNIGKMGPAKYQKGRIPR